MSEYTVRLDGFGGRGRILHLLRLPLFLRFVICGSDWRSLDALDQLDDQASPMECVIPAKWSHSTTVHIDRRENGKHIGEWRTMHHYEPVDCELTQEQLKDNPAWREWCAQSAADQDLRDSWEKLVRDLIAKLEHSIKSVGGPYEDTMIADINVWKARADALAGGHYQGCEAAEAAGGEA